MLVRNAGPVLERLLNAVSTQRTNRRLEIVAVDSGSSDGTRAILANHGARLIDIGPDTFNFGLTRDLAFENSRGEFIVSLSQDAVPAHESWLENILAPLADPDVAVSCGRSLPDPERSTPQFPWERNGYFYFTREMDRFRCRYGRGLSNANAAYKRGVWERLRFGAQPIGEDYRFQTKLHDAGLRIAFPDDAPVLHHHDYAFGSLIRRCRNEGLGLRELGFPYNESDLIADLLSPGKYVAWLRDLLRGRLRTGAALLFPVVRPVSVYAGSRFGKRFRP